MTSLYWDPVCFAYMILNGEVTESAVRSILYDVLYERGAVPVGELGKILQEMSCVTNFSAKLKEKFGGLKKYLEKYSEDFTICTDHPFNPHIFLTKFISSDEKSAILSGTIPQSFVTKNKKVLHYITQNYVYFFIF